MAQQQLPPKAGPAVSSSTATFFCSPAARTSRAEDFLGFSAARRSAHRSRTVCDPVTFPEPAASIVVSAAIEDALLCRGGGGAHSTRHDPQFDRLDDDQLTSMFSDEATPPSSLSTPPDHNSAAGEEKGPQLLAAACEQHPQEAQSPAAAAAPMDPKRVKRILANRQSAQRSRVRKLHYISILERSVSSLQNEVSALSPRVAFLDQQRSLLTAGNSALKQRIAALAQDKIFKDAHQEALKEEIERLRRVYQEQSSKKMASAVAAVAPTVIEPIPGASNMELLG